MKARILALVMMTAALAGCTGALAGATFGGSGDIGYQGWVDVVVTSPAGDLMPARTVFVDDGRHVSTAVSDAQGRARLTLVWPVKHSARDSAGDYLLVRLSLTNFTEAALEVLVRPGRTSNAALSPASPYRKDRR